MPNPFDKKAIDQATQGIQLQGVMPTQKPSFLDKAALPIEIAGQAADGITTQMALKDGMTEGNPLMPKGALPNALYKAGMTAGIALMSHELRKHGHPKAATNMDLAAGVGGFIPAMMNAYSINKR